MSKRDNKVPRGELHMYCHVSKEDLMGWERRGFPAAVSAGVERERRAYLSPAARAARHHRLADGRK